MAKPGALFPLLLILTITNLAFSLDLSHDESESREQQQGRDNPYFFDEQSFRTPLQTQHGKLSVLERFTRRSKLLRGIENYRIALFQANPNTALVPSHCDCEAIMFIVSGSATITLLRHDNRESYNLRTGDILKVNAGTTVYIINNDNKEKLYIAKMLETISTPGQFQPFFGIGGQNTESYLLSFSSDILEAAFNTEYDKVRRVFGQQQEGPFMRVSQEKIKEVVQQASSSQGRHSSAGGRSRGPFNLLEKPPTYSNKHGKMYEVDANDYPALRDQDIGISVAMIRGGSMAAPYYNSKATKMAVVLDGNGYVEIMCPHLAERSREEGDSSGSRSGSGEGRDLSRQEGQQQQEQESVSYQKVSSRISPGQVFVVPPGHPVVTVAHEGQDLFIICFETNAVNNEKHTLAGSDNKYRSMNKVEREVFFKESEKVVEEVFKAQKEAGLLEGPKGKQGRESDGGRSVARNI